MADANPFEPFLTTIRSGAPVLIQVGMTDPSHGNTKDPIEIFSPLIKTAMAAVDLGAKELVFSPSQKFGAILGDVHTSKFGLRDLVPEVVRADGAAPQTDSDAPGLQKEHSPTKLRPSIPGLFLHWCNLNGAFFPYTISRGRDTEEIKSWPEDLPFPMRADFDPKNDAHVRAMTQILALFLEKSRNYAQAADRVRAAITNNGV